MNLPNLTRKDIHLIIVALDVAISDLARKGKAEHPAYEGYLESRRKLRQSINENSRPEAPSPRPALERHRITPAQAGAFLGMPVSRVRDLGGKVVLAWIEGTGCRFVSRARVEEFFRPPQVQRKSEVARIGPGAM